MYKVWQHWDPLETCVVGRSYPPEFYSWIAVPRVRELFERIAVETEEDFQNIIDKLEQFGVKVLRPRLPKNNIDTAHRFIAPPMTPRDTMIMVGEKLFCTFDQESNPDLHYCYQDIFDHVAQQGNDIIARCPEFINGAMVSRLGRDLFFATNSFDQDPNQLQHAADQHFPAHRNHIVNTGGHGDGSYCPVAPGLIISIRDVKTYANTFPGWEVLYLPNQSWNRVGAFLDLKERNHGRWWIPGFEYDEDVIQVVDTWLDHWVGYVEETVFDVNMLIIDPKNVIIFNYNQTVIDRLARSNIKAHVVPFRHRYFWDGGIHCVTLDLDRQGHMQDFFPGRTH